MASPPRSPRLVLVDGEIRTDIEQRGVLNEEDDLYMSIRDEGQTNVWYEDEFFKDMKRKDIVKYLIERNLRVYGSRNDLLIRYAKARSDAQQKISRAVVAPSSSSEAGVVSSRVGEGSSSAEAVASSRGGVAGSSSGGAVASSAIVESSPSLEAVAKANSSQQNQSRGRAWTMNESLRLLRVLADPENLTAVRKLLDGNAATRQEIDIGLMSRSPFDDAKDDSKDVKGHPAGPLNRAFNDPSNNYDPIQFDPDEFPALADARKELNPNSFSVRPKRTLHERYVKLKQQYSEVWIKFSRSGQHNEMAFKNFCKGDVVMQYARCLSKENDLFSQAILRPIQHAFRNDDPAYSTVDPAAECDLNAMSRKRKSIPADTQAIINMCSIVGGHFQQNSQNASVSGVSSATGVSEKRVCVSIEERKKNVASTIGSLTQALANVPEGSQFDAARTMLQLELEDYLNHCHQDLQKSKRKAPDDDDLY